MTTTALMTTATRLRWLLVLWTLAVWGSRLRNIVVDDELAGLDRVVSFAVAVVLIASAIAVGAALRTGSRHLRSALLVLATIGVLRWTIRGPLILVSDEWEAGFKVVHTILWLLTVALSALAWREQQRSEAR